jgi:hypothetical protein
MAIEIILDTSCRCCHDAQFDGYLQHEREFLDNPAQIKCIACGWMMSDPKFRKEEPRYFLSDSVDKRIEWQQVNSGFDLYEPKSGACQLKISVSYFNYSVRHDPSAPVIMGRGMIACNTPALQEWWDGKRHHKAHACEVP